MNVEQTLSRSASFVSSIIDPSAFFVHFFNSFLLILKILVRDDLRRSQIRYSKGHTGLSWTYKFVTVSTEGKRIFEIIIRQSQTEEMNFTVDLRTGFGLCTWESYDMTHTYVTYESEAMTSFNPIYLVASSTASWKFFISPCDLCVYRSIPALKFLLKAVSNFSYLRLKKYA